MKFQMYGKDFKTFIDRIGGIVAKKSSLHALETVKISAHGNFVEFSATDTVDYATIKSYASVYEEGTVWAFLSDLKKILAIESDITITADHGKLDIRSAKKSYEIPCHDDYIDLWSETPIIDNNNVLCIQKEKEFLKHLSMLDCMRSSEEANKMMTAFYFDFPNRKIVTLDGHRIGVANLAGGMIAPDSKSIIVDGSLYAALKSIAGKNKDEERRIEIYADNKCTAFHGEDYVLTVRNVNGIYFDYERLIKDNLSNSDYTYKCNTKELSKIAKEYSKVIAGDKAPMILYNNNGTIATGVQVSGYRTSDVLENVESEYGMGCEWFVGINPRFIMDACNAFSNSAEVRGNYNYKKPIMIMDSTYEFLILPVNINTDNVEFVKKQVA